MYNELLEIIAIGLLFTGLFVFEPWNALVERHLNFKPFNCVLCFSLYGSFLLMLFCSDLNPLYSIISAFVAEFTFRKMM